MKYITSLIQKKPSEILEDDKFYDVTNLINCCLGLVSYVYEDTMKYNKRKRNKALDMLREILQNYPYEVGKYGNIEISWSVQGKKDIVYKDMPTLLYHMRNAICHGNILPSCSNPDENGDQPITAIIFTDMRGKTENFKATMDIVHIQNFANDVAEAYISYNTENNKKQQ
ncbi:MAG: hypothetical protein IJ776_10225 [Paludibacteraceae bacterium]|nr:hypothetical protein [Paludibacteraceae bacterium]